MVQTAVLVSYWMFSSSESVMLCTLVTVYGLSTSYMQLCGFNGSEQVAHTACLSLGLCVSLNGLRERVQLLLRLRLHCHQDGGRRRSRVCVEVSRATAACTQTRPCVSEKARIGAACHGCRYIFGNLMRTSQVELLIQVRIVQVYTKLHIRKIMPPEVQTTARSCASTSAG